MTFFLKKLVCKLRLLIITELKLKKYSQSSEVISVRRKASWGSNLEDFSSVWSKVPNVHGTPPIHWKSPADSQSQREQIHLRENKEDEDYRNDRRRTDHYPRSRFSRICNSPKPSLCIHAQHTNVHTYTSSYAYLFLYIYPLIFVLFVYFVNLVVVAIGWKRESFTWSGGEIYWIFYCFVLCLGCCAVFGRWEDMGKETDWGFGFCIFLLSFTQRRV